MSGFLNDIPRAAAYALNNARVPLSVCDGFAVRDVDRRSGLGTVDLTVVDGRFATPAIGLPAGLPSLDLRGRLVLPGFVDMHVHLDKAHTLRRTGLPEGGLGDAVRLSIADAANRTETDLRRRMEFSLRCAYAHGTVALRTHLDTPQVPDESASWRVFDALQERWSGRIALQGSGLMAIDRVDDMPGFRQRCLQLARRGAVPGAFVAEGTATTERLERFLAIAGAAGTDVDFHVDETLSADANGLRRIAEAVLRTAFAGKVTVGHCCSLAAQAPASVNETLDMVAAARLNVVSLPLTNMFLMDRAPNRTPRRRGITLVHEMKARGIPVSFASDNICDPFFAYGDFDMLEVMRAAVRAAHLDAGLDEWIRSANDMPARALGMTGSGRLGVGGAADLVVLRARDWTELLSRPHSDRVVIRAGKAVDGRSPDFEDLEMEAS